MLTWSLLVDNNNNNRKKKKKHLDWTVIHAVNKQSSGTGSLESKFSAEKWQKAWDKIVYEALRCFLLAQMWKVSLWLMSQNPISWLTSSDAKISSKEQRSTYSFSTGDDIDEFSKLKVIILILLYHSGSHL